MNHYAHKYAVHDSLLYTFTYRVAIANYTIFSGPDQCLSRGTIYVMKHASQGRNAGFTVIELIIVVVFLAVAAVFLFVQRTDLIATNNDTLRKTAVNAMYYSLEKVYYQANSDYPETISSKTLPSVDPALFTDTSGKKPGDAGYEYRYSASNCTSGHCHNYTLSVNLQKEAIYTKKSDR